jgi:hypothetical protein
MRKLTSILILVCGILVVAGIFLPWVSGGDMDSSGWKEMTNGVMGGIDKNPMPLFMLIGGVLAILCSGLVLMGKGSLRTLRMLEIVSLVGATLAAGPALCLVIPAGGDAGYGLYISTAGAVIGVIVGAIAATRITRKKVEAE